MTVFCRSAGFGKVFKKADNTADDDIFQWSSITILLLPTVRTVTKEQRTRNYSQLTVFFGLHARGNVQVDTSTFVPR